MKNINNVLDIILKTILKIRISPFYDNLYSKNCRILPVFGKNFRHFWGKENDLVHFSYNIKCGYLKKK